VLKVCFRDSKKVNWHFSIFGKNKEQYMQEIESVEIRYLKISDYQELKS